MLLRVKFNSSSCIREIKRIFYLNMIKAKSFFLYLNEETLFYWFLNKIYDFNFSDIFNDDN